MNTNKSLKKIKKSNFSEENKSLSSSGKNYYDYVKKLKCNREELNDCDNDYNAVFMMF